VMEISISENSDKKRFESKVDGAWAFIEYIRVENKMYLTHTEVPSAMEGKGIASLLVKHALDIIAKEERKLVPLCPFVAAYVKKHPEYEGLLAAGYKV
jgi:uncharacterized protein